MTAVRLVIPRCLAAALLLVLAGWLLPWAAAAQPKASPAAPVYVVPIEGAIGPATASLVQRGIDKARRGDAQLLVLRIDTPGGLDPSMRLIVQEILASPVPVLSYVHPGGARAASAGTFILYASHLAAMTPGTNLGAASPVRIGLGEPERSRESGASAADASAPRTGPADTLERKQLHDAAAYIRGLAQLRGRNAEWGERAVREAVSLSADEAAAQDVIDVVATDLAALLRAIDGRKVKAGGVERTLHTTAAPVVTLEPDWRYRLLAVITEPSVALLLMMIGIYGLIFEFSTPGMVLPGVAGAICLLLGLFALQMLPVNYAGLALIALGIGCMVAEAFLPSFGVLGLGGIVAFALGAVMLIDTDVPGLGVPAWMIATLTLCAGVLSFGISAAAVRARGRPAAIGETRLTGDRGRMLDPDWAEVQGERWRVRSHHPLREGDPVRVTGRQGLVLTVEPVDADRAPPSRPSPSPLTDHDSGDRR